MLIPIIFLVLTTIVYRIYSYRFTKEKQRLQRLLKQTLIDDICYRSANDNSFSRTLPSNTPIYLKTHELNELTLDELRSYSPNHGPHELPTNKDIQNLLKEVRNDVLYIMYLEKVNNLSIHNIEFIKIAYSSIVIYKLLPFETKKELKNSELQNPTMYLYFVHILERLEDRIKWHEQQDNDFTEEAKQHLSECKNDCEVIV